MASSDLTGLFDLNPLVRLWTAEQLSDADRDSLSPPADHWYPNVYGAANAWVVAVGPSPGDPGGKPKAPRTTIHRPVLWNVNTKLGELETEGKTFWNELFRLIRAGFKRIGVLDRYDDATLRLMLMMNLDTTPEGKEENIPVSKLLDGIGSRLWPVLRAVKPRIVLALTKRVYKLIWDDLEKYGACAMGREREHHPVPAGDRSYSGKSCWVSHPEVGQFLFVRLLQHPRWEPSYHPYRRRFSAYVGRRFRDAQSGPVSTVELSHELVAAAHR